tara:strand:- start:475 stop:672 length:198 start_codon:yes stop_codon:yes gene_type:complete
MARLAARATAGVSNSTNPNPRDNVAPPGPRVVATFAANTRPEAADAARKKCARKAWPDKKESVSL